MTARRKLMILMLFIVILATTILFIFDPLSTIYGVTANTEKITIVTRDDNNSRMILNGVDFFEFDDTDVASKSNYDCDIRINKGVTVSIERIGSGTARISLQSDNSRYIGKLFEAGGETFQLLESPLQIVIDSVAEKSDLGQTVLIPINGLIEIGSQVGYAVRGQSNALLRSGRLTMTGSSKYIVEDFDAGTVDLQLGDELIFDGENVNAYGFIALNEQPGIQVAYRVNASGARILKPGPQVINGGVVISATALDRILKSPTYQNISILFGVILVLIGILTFVLDLFIFLAENKTTIAKWLSF